MGTLTSNSPGLLPAPIKGQALNSNYLSFTDGTNDFAQQYLPELYEAEVERYGNRTISGFLRMVGAEMPMTSDQVVWSEQNRLHVSYDTAAIDAAVATDIDITTGAGNECAIKVNQTIVVQGATGEMTALVTKQLLACRRLYLVAFGYKRYHLRVCVRLRRPWILLASGQATVPSSKRWALAIAGSLC